MTRLFAMSALLVISISLGCGSGEMGPADPSQTPQVSEDEIQNKMSEGYSKMPAEAQKQYQKQYGSAAGGN